MAKGTLNFAKVVANPSPAGWSQVYSAGKLFAALSLQKEGELEQKDYLNVLGKEILDTLEQEFFTLETKDLESIRQAVLTTSSKIPEDVGVSFAVGAVVENVLYLFILGGGKVDIKRGQTLGTLLAVKEDGRELKEASGFLQDQDIVILETSSFSDEISESVLLEFLEKPSIDEAAENLAPLVHEKENALVSCILVYFKEGSEDVNSETVMAENSEEVKTEDENKEEVETEDNKESLEEKDAESSKENEVTSPPASSFFQSIRVPKVRRPGAVRESRNLILVLIVVVILILAASVFFAWQKQQSQKTLAAFNAVYSPAEKKYNEGQSLLDLNQALAQDSFNEAKNILDKGKNDFAQGSGERKQIDTLETKVNDALSKTATESVKNAVEASKSDSFYLSTELDNASALAFTKDSKNVYYITKSSILSLADGSKTPKTLVKTANWTTVGGIATYNTNLYVVEKKGNQILKYTNTGSAYEESEYFASNTGVDFSNASSIAIDNNIYVLSTDGTISKYFKGKAVDFTLKGLDKNLKNSTKIYTTPDFDNIYILDKGNSRIVTLDKTGTFKAQYVSKQLANATDFEVLESDKTIYFLSGGKIYKLTF